MTISTTESNENVFDIENTEVFSDIKKNDRRNNILKYSFIAVCMIFYFIATIVLSKDPTKVYGFVFLKNHLTVEGFFLSNFMHGGLFHLGMNLLSFGFIMNRLFFVKTQYIIFAMIGSAIGSSGMSYFLAPDNVGVVGASGLIFGLAMFFFLYLANIKFNENSEESYYLKGRINRNLLINSIFMVGINFVPGIAWFAHLGGALVGIAGFYLLKSMNKIDFSPESIYLMFKKGV